MKKSAVTALRLGSQLIKAFVATWASATLVAGAQPTTPASQLALGGQHGCGVSISGAALCFGNNSEGQLGDGTFTPRDQPTVVSGLGSGVAAIAAGGIHTCALTTTGGVKCWGSNAEGQLGNGSHASSATPVDVTGLTSGVAAIAAGSAHTCALTTAGAVRCWGSNTSGQLGDNSTTERTAPVAVSGLASGVASLGLGESHSCAITTGGGVKCWGQNTFGQLGDNSNTERTTPVDVSGFASGGAAVMGGRVHTCALTTSGGLKCWGRNFFGQLGDGTTVDRAVPTDVSGHTSGVTAFGAGAFTSCAVTTGGALKCWGFNITGGLGDGTQFPRLLPVPVSQLGTGVTRVSIGDGTTCAIVTDGGARCWGGGLSGLLADGTGGVKSTPVAVASLTSGVAKVSAGGSHICTTNTAGALTCWGSDIQRQLGIVTPPSPIAQSYNSRFTPTPVPDLASGVQAISSGEEMTCAITAGGAAKCWGRNNVGQVGNNNGGDTTPQQVIGLTSGVVSISAGGNHVCAVVSTGGVKCWGASTYGAIGDGSSGAQITAPADVIGLTGPATAVSVGGFHSCALLASGAVQCWGNNTSGQLGNGNFTSSLSPVNVGGLTGVTAIEAGYTHTCALLSTGGVRCWGDNADGQLGDGTTTNRNVPTAVTGLSSGVTAISMHDASCALMSNGGVKCWGLNSGGTVGNGTVVSPVLTPSDVIGLPASATAISTGGANTCAVLSTGALYCWGYDYYLGNGGNTYPRCVVNTPCNAIGGTITGLTASGLVLSLNSGELTTSPASGASNFAFAPRIGPLRAYTVSVQTQPTGLTCSVGSASGTTKNATYLASAPDVTNIAVTCSALAPTTYTVTASAGPNGTLSCASPVNAGQTSTCTATPSSGYRTLSISGCGGTATAAGVNNFTTGAVNANCTVSASFDAVLVAVNGSCGSSNGLASVSAPSAGLCLAGTASSVSSATLAYSWTCVGSNGGTTASCNAPRTGLGNVSFGAAAVTGTTVPPTGSGGAGSASFTTSNGGATCGFDTAATGFIASTAAHPSSGSSQPQGMYRFRLTNCTPGFTARVTINWPSLAGLTVFKYGKATLTASTASFFAPNNLAVSGNAVSFDITDGQVGDDDGLVNGQATDPIAPVLLAAPPVSLAPSVPVPTLGHAGLGLLLLCVLGLAARRVNPRRYRAR